VKSAIALILLLLAGLLVASFLRGCANEHSRGHGHHDVSFALSPSGDSLVFNGVGQGGWDLYRLDLKSKQVARIAETPDYETSPSFSPDGRSIVYSAGVPGDRADHVFIRSLDGTAPRQVTREDANDTSPEFSPDGSRIVFARDKTYDWGGKASNWAGGVICVANLDGSGLREITNEVLSAWFPHFSPDGLTILFSADSGIYTVPADGSEPPKRLNYDGGGPVFSPDGQTIAFSKGQYSPDQSIYVCHLDGKDLRKVVHLEGGASCPLFKRDGKGLYFLNEAWPDGYTGHPKFSLWEVDLIGRTPKLVADARLIDDPMGWKP
jgi:Tol biopolymer transport system component